VGVESHSPVEIIDGVIHRLLVIRARQPAKTLHGGLEGGYHVGGPVLEAPSGGVVQRQFEHFGDPQHRSRLIRNQVAETVLDHRGS